jgi:hypothetical protein
LFPKTNETKEQLVRIFLPFLCLLSGVLLQAQSSTSIPVTASDQAAMAKLQILFFEQSLRDVKEDSGRRQIAAHDEAIMRFQFNQKANRFVALWGDFVQRLNDQQTVDAKLAKKLSKAFHELEASDGWPLREAMK